MGGRAIPDQPVFAGRAERAIWEALRDSLRDGEVLLHGLRFTDAQAGDVEIDLLLLVPQRGAAVLEVKGGVVAYRDGQWTSTASDGAVRRIHPIAQARRAKHALRKYLDRQPEWDLPLLPTQWLLALPRTTVTGDLGPEGRREQIIAAGDTDVRGIVDAALEELAATPPADPDWVEKAVQLLLSAPEASTSRDRWAAADDASPARSRRTLAVAGAAAVLAAVGIGGGATALALRSDSGPAAVPVETTVTPTGSCDPGYSPCVRQAEDRDCTDLGFRVQVLSTADPYDLDRDRNGIGCESYPVSATGEE